MKVRYREKRVGGEKLYNLNIDHGEVLIKINQI